MVALPKKEMCFWPAKTRKNLDFFEMHTSLEPGAQKLLSFHSRCVSEKSCIVCCNEFFISVSGFILKLSSIALFRKRLQLDSESGLTTNGLILEFLVGVLLVFVDFISAWTEIFMNCSIVFLFLTTSSFFNA